MKDEFPYHWHIIESEKFTEEDVMRYLYELKERVKALESTQHAHVDTSQLSEKEKWNTIQKIKQTPTQSTARYQEPQTPEEVASGLKEAFQQATKEGVVSPGRPNTHNTCLIERIGNLIPLKESGAIDHEKVESIIHVIADWLEDNFNHEAGIDWVVKALRNEV